MEFVFFLSAFILILKGQDALFVPLVGLAMLNKETAWVLPFVYLVNRLEPAKIKFRERPMEFLVQTVRASKSLVPVLARFALGLGLAAAVYFGLRFYYGTNREFSSIPKIGPGWELFKWNLAQKNLYLNWLVFFNFLLLAPWWDWKRKPAFIKRSTYVLLSFFVGGSLFFAAPEEVRLFFPVLPLLLTAGLLNIGQWTKTAVQPAEEAGAKKGRN